MSFQRLSRPASLVVTRAASAAYVPCFVVASVMSVVRGHKAYPLGIHTPFPVPVDVAVGAGTGLSAPWPMIIWLWSARRRVASRGAEGRRATAVMALLGSLFLAGSVAEPISHRLLAGRLRRDEAVLVVLNLALPIAMLVGALVSLVGRDASDRKVGFRNAVGTAGQVERGSVRDRRAPNAVVAAQTQVGQ